MVVFEIRVAVIGYVSVGKTTVINALLGSQYGEVAMKRTTAVVNSYRVTQAKKKKEDPQDEGVTDESEDDSVQIVPKPRTQLETLKESMADNAANRNNIAGAVKEKTYDIEIDETLHELREDTKLVIVDIPGINEAGTSSKYKDYVNEKWHTFDVAVIVMDGRQGVNTEEQMDLLKLAKENTKTSKNIPIIILCNKVDDPDDQEQSNLLKEARGAIQDLFRVKDRKKALADMIREANKQDSNGRCKAAFLPVVVPISAMHAFLYRSGSRLTFEQFKKMDKDFIEKIGKESYGRQWRSYKAHEKLEKAYEAVSDEEQRKDGLEASKFDHFVKALAYCIGGEKRQATIIRQQVEVSMDRMYKVKDDCDLSGELFLAHCKLTAIDSSTDHLRAAFWRAFKKVRIDALSAFTTNFSPAAFQRPMQQLLAYFTSLDEFGWEDQRKKVVEEVKDLVLNYVMEVLNHENELNKKPGDFALILGSMLLMSHNSQFCMNFGSLKLELDKRYFEARIDQTLTGETFAIDPDGKCLECNGVVNPKYDNKSQFCGACNINWIFNTDLVNCPACDDEVGCQLSRKKKAGGILVLICNQSCQTEFRVRQSSRMKIADNRLVPHADNSRVPSIVVPDSVDDSKHFGYPIWQCCQLLNKVANSD